MRQTTKKSINRQKLSNYKQETFGQLLPPNEKSSKKSIIQKYSHQDLKSHLFKTSNVSSLKSNDISNEEFSSSEDE